MAAGLILAAGLLVPLGLFLNRFLIPDVSFDSLNYHLFLGYRGWKPQFMELEFFPTGIHNFSPLLEMIGYGFFSLLGYRSGTIFSLLTVYIGIFLLYKIYKLIFPQSGLTADPIRTFLFISVFLSFELFLGIATYYNDSLVWAMSLAAVYWLLKFIKQGKTGDWWLMSVMLGLLVLGKMTNVYLALACFFSGTIALMQGKGKTAGKVKTFVMGAGLAMAVPLGEFIKNWRQTGNPVFPFYNSIFKSSYFPDSSFAETRFGGESVLERLGWGMFSALKPERLGEIHDLFHDYKINIYFGLVLIGLGLWAAGRIQDRLVKYLLATAVVGFIAWSYLFGYLRYGLVLESIGGLVLLVGYEKSKGWQKLVFVPLLAVLLLQNKRVVNLSLAYDVSFRPGHYYNRHSYGQNIDDLWTSRIKVNEVGQKPAIYLNCAAGGMSYYVLSPYANLPVLNIDTKAYAAMTLDADYARESQRRITKNDGGRTIDFVTIVARSGLNNEYQTCINELKRRGWQVEKEATTDFVGYQPQKLVVIFGKMIK